MSAVESAVAEATRTSALPVTQRAAIALQSAETEKQLLELATKHKDIVAVTNKDGREQAHRAYMVLRTTRVEIEKRGKAAREDATAFSKAVIAEEKRLLGLITPEESRLQALRDEFDAIEERRRQEAIEAERQRVAAIEREIEEIRGAVLGSAGKSAEAIADRIREIEAQVIDEAVFMERTDIARQAQAETLERLREIHAEREAFEAEQARLAEERARLEEQRRKDAEAAAERQREEDERRRQEEARIAEERAKLQAEREAAAKAEAERRAALRREEEAREAERRAEQERRDREEAERQARIREEEEARVAEQRRIEAERQQLAQERAFIDADRKIAEQSRIALAATDVATAEAALNQMLCMEFDPVTYGDRAGDLNDIVRGEQDRISDHIQSLTPPPPVAGELTPAPSGPQDAGPAAAAVGAGDDDADEVGAVLAAHPYPGHSELVAGICTQFLVPPEAATQWLHLWAESNGVVL